MRDSDYEIARHQPNLLNHQTINKALGYDDSELHKAVQVTKIGSTPTCDLFYISSHDNEEKYGDVEAYVLCDNKGNVSYYDFKHEVVVFENQLRDDWSPYSYSYIPSVLRDRLEEIINNHYFESNGINVPAEDIAAGIPLFYTLLEEMYNY